jgi:SNF2 family DNA or RNA helicase
MEAVVIHVSGQHRIVGVPKDPRVLNMFPNAKELTYQGNELALIPHGLHETLMLRNMGYDVPAPIMEQYTFPAPRNEPAFRVQKLTAALFTTARRAYCLNGMGTGKTRAAIWAFDYLKKNNMAEKALVVCPLSVMDNVWRREVFKVCPHLSVGVLHSHNRAKRLQVLDQDHDIYVVNTDGLRVIEDELLAKPGLSAFILDELALFRNSNERSKCARRIAARMDWVWGLTGSPTPQEPTDAWGQCKIVTPHTVPKHYGTFRQEVMLKVSQFKFVPKKEATKRVFEVMQPAVRFTLEDVTELPDVIERTVDVAMGATQDKIYNALRQHAFVAYKDKQITAVNAAAALIKLLQVSLGYVYADGRGVVALDGVPRLDAIVDAVLSTDRKCLIFVPFTHALEGIHAKLTHEGIDAAMVHGKTPKKERDNIFNLFQNSNKFKAIVAHPGCMAHGLTLTAADTIIWAGPVTSLETFEQANARIRRVGQKHKQLVLMMQSSEVERKLYARLRAKQHVQDNLLALFEEATDA